MFHKLPWIWMVSANIYGLKLLADWQSESFVFEINLSDTVLSNTGSVKSLRSSVYV